MSRPREGKPSDEEKIAAALPKARTVLATLARLKRSGSWLLGDDLTLADLHAAPIFAYFLKAPEGKAMLADHPELTAWWSAMSARPAFRSTEPST